MGNDTKREQPAFLKRGQVPDETCLIWELEI